MIHKKHGYLPEDAVLFESTFLEDDGNNTLVELIDVVGHPSGWNWRCCYVKENGMTGLWKKSELIPLTRAAKALFGV